MMVPDAIQTAGGNWIPTIVHTERDNYRIERLPASMYGCKSTAFAEATRVIAARQRTGYVQRMIDRRARI